MIRYYCPQCGEVREFLAEPIQQPLCDNNTCFMRGGFLVRVLPGQVIYIRGVESAVRF